MGSSPIWSINKIAREEANTMAKARSGASEVSKKRRPAISPEARENQLISLAVDLAEQQLRDGTASSQVITHFLKLGTTRAELEKEKLRIENKKTEAQIKSIEKADASNELYENALKAMKDYSGHGDEDYEY